MSIPLNGVWSRRDRLIAGIFAIVPAIAAAQVPVAIVDPSGALIPAAHVVAICERSEENFATRSDHLGRLEIPWTDSPCDLIVEAPGFAAWHGLLADVARRGRLQLAIASLTDHLRVVGTARWAALGSATIDRREFDALGWDSGAALRLARARAGATLQHDAVYIDGAPASTLPPAAAMRSLSLNADPFSVLYSESDANVIEIDSAVIDRRFRWSANVAPLRLGARNPLAPDLEQRRRVSGLSVDAPLPGTPMTLSLYGASHSYSEGRPVITGEGPQAGGALAAGSGSSVSAQLSGEMGRGLRTTLSVTSAFGRDEAISVGGTVRPEATMAGSTGSVDGRWMLEVARPQLRHRGILTYSSMDTVLEAASTDAGTLVVDDETSGGAPIAASRTSERRLGWTQIVDSADGGWLSGASVAHESSTEDLVPNAAGQWQFGSRAALERARYGGEAATLLRASRPTRQVVEQTTAALFLQRRWEVNGVSVRGGLRSDYQSGDGHLLSPRLSVRRAVGPFTLRWGGGIFRQHWSTAVLTQARRFASGRSDRELLTATLSAADAPISRQALLSDVGADFARPRSLVVVSGIEWSDASVDLGAEHRWTRGSHRPGMRRVMVDAGWLDLLESRRRLERHQVHARIQLRLRLVDVLANVEWIVSRDDGDGPFAFPENQSDVRERWARSAGVAPHHFSIVVTPPLIHGVSAGLIMIARSSAPLDLRTGLDLDGSGLFVDRGGFARNSGAGPAYRSLDAYAQRRVVLPFVRFRHRPVCAVAVFTADNLWGDRNITSVGTIRLAPTSARALGAAPGRTVRLSVRFAR